MPQNIIAQAAAALLPGIIANAVGAAPPAAAPPMVGQVGGGCHCPHCGGALAAGVTITAAAPPANNPFNQGELTAIVEQVIAQQVARQVAKALPAPKPKRPARAAPKPPARRGGK